MGREPAASGERMTASAPSGPIVPSGRPSSAVPLRDVEEGATGVVNNIAEHAEDDADLMHYLQRSSLVPGTRLHVDEVARSNATITVSLLDENRQVVVGLHTADLVLVRNVN